MTFNAKAVAEKLVTKFNGEGACLSNTDEAYLQEMVEKYLLEAHSAGVAEGLEEAAKIVDDHESGCVLQSIGVAEAIRRLKEPRSE